MSAQIKTTSHSKCHNGDVIYHRHRELTGEELGQMFDEHEKLLFDKPPGATINIILKGETFEEAVKNPQIEE